MNSKLPLVQQLQHRQQLGKQGEDYAATYLIQKGYTIIDRNFKINPGEIDIVALAPQKETPFFVKSFARSSEKLGQILVFVEVKTRIGREFGLPEEAVTPRKLREVIKTADYYVLTHPNLPKLHRIDVIAIEYDEIGKIVYFKDIENVTG